MAILTTPRSQALRFIDKAKINDVQNYDNRFVHDLVYAKTLPYYYIQQFEQGDNLWVQFRTDIPIELINVNLVDEDNNYTLLTETAVYTDSSGRTYYNVNVPISGITGCHFVELSSDGGVDVPPFQIQSEAFNISPKLDNSIYIKWFGNDSYDDMMHWTDLHQGIRLVGRDRELIPDQNKTTYDNSDYAPITLKSKPIRRMELEINLAPYWLIEKINLGLSHDNFYVQEVQYNTDAVIEIERLGDILLKKGIVELTQLDFEDGEDSVISGTAPQSYLKINDTDYLIINDSGDRLKINN